METEKVPVLRGFTEIRNVWRYVQESRNVVICGGYVRYMVSTNKKPASALDVDLFPTEDSAYGAAKSHFDGEGFVTTHENEISLTLTPPKKGSYGGCPKLQLIKPIRRGAIVATGSMEDILDNFDFTVVRAGLLSPETALVDKDFTHDEANLYLNIKNIHCPISSCLRFLKYSRKGYWTNPRQILKLFVNWDERDVNYRMKIINLFEREDLSQEDINELEALLWVD